MTPSFAVRENIRCGGPRWWGLVICAMSAFLAAGGDTCAAADATAPTFPAAGEWTGAAANPSLNNRVAGKGSMTAAPQVAWKHFLGRNQTTLLVEPAANAGQVAVTAKTGGNVPADAAWSQRWTPPGPQGLVAGQPQALPLDSDTTFADVLPDVPGLEKFYFQSGWNKGPGGTRQDVSEGRMFAWKNGQWQQVWQTEPMNMPFGMYPLAGDFDGDGRLEIALLPWYQVSIYDAATGKLKDSCKFTEGRSYGTFGVYDMNGDGKSEFLVMGDFAQHVDVLGYVGGKLKLLWQDKIDPDITTAYQGLRLIPEPCGNFAGGKSLQVSVNLYDGRGDRRWHLILRDGMTGKVLVNQADEIALDTMDVNGDGRRELLTAQTSGQGLPKFGLIRVRTLEGDKLSTLWEGRDMGWILTSQVPKDLHTQGASTSRGRLGVITRKIAGRTAVVLRSKGASDRSTSLCVAKWEAGGFKVATRLSGADLDCLAMDANGAMLATFTTVPGAGQNLTVNGGRATVLATAPMPATPAPPSVVRDSRDARPTIIAQGYGKEILLLQTDGSAQGVHERRRVAGQAPGNWPAVYAMVTADLRGDGGRQLLYGDAAPGGYARLVAQEIATGAEAWHSDFEHIPGELPIWNVGGLLYWTVGHFTQARTMDVLMNVRRSIMHSDETHLVDGRTGKQAWHRIKGAGWRSAGGHPYAVADFNGDGLDDAVSGYCEMHWIFKGTDGKDIQAGPNTWAGLGENLWEAAFVAGLSDAAGKPVYAFCNSTASALIRPDNTVAARLEHGSNFGDFDGSGKLEVIQADGKGAKCYDALAGTLLWELPATPDAAGIAGSAICADLNGDGRPDALFSAGQTLYCVAYDAQAKRGRLLWKVVLPAACHATAVADVNGSGLLSILVSGSDGYLYCLKASR